MVLAPLEGSYNEQLDVWGIDRPAIMAGAIQTRTQTRTYAREAPDTD